VFRRPNRFSLPRLRHRNLLRTIYGIALSIPRDCASDNSNSVTSGQEGTNCPLQLSIKSLLQVQHLTLKIKHAKQDTTGCEKATLAARLATESKKKGEHRQKLLDPDILVLPPIPFAKKSLLAERRDREFQGLLLLRPISTSTPLRIFLGPQG